MGVRNLNVLLKRFAPQLTKPNTSFGEYRGKRLAIDANLVTQKFFHTNDDNPNRVLTYWYSFLSNLLEYGITPVCIFDGTERPLLKQRELLKRKQSRDLASKRGLIETQRNLGHQHVIELLNALKLYAQYSGPGAPELKHRYLESLVNTLHHVDSTLVPLINETAQSSSSSSSSSSSVQGSIFNEAPFSPRLFAFGKTLSLFLGQNNSMFSSTEAAAETGLVDSDEIDVNTRPQDLIDPEFNYQHVQGSLETWIQQLNESVSSSQVSLTRSNLTPRQKDIDADEDATINTTLRQLSSPDNIKDLSLDSWHYLELKSQTVSSAFLRTAEVITIEKLRECQQLITGMGIPVIVSKPPFEAEALCSAFVKNDLAKSVISEDADVLVHCSSLLRNATGSRAEAEMFKIHGDEVRHALGNLTKEQWLDLAILCGTDFASTLPKVGPITAHKLIMSHGSIESILNSNPKYFPTLEAKGKYLEEIKGARLMFTQLPVLSGYQNSIDLFVPEDPHIVNRLLNRSQTWSESASEEYFNNNTLGDSPSGLQEVFDTKPL